MLPPFQELSKMSFFTCYFRPNIRPKVSANLAEYSVSAETRFTSFGRTLEPSQFTVTIFSSLNWMKGGPLA